MLQKRALLGEPSLTASERQLVRRISSRISSRDDMYYGNSAHYFGIGLSAIRCIDEVLERAGHPDVRSILDLPCGHGRVLRWLAARFPRARITACDLDRGGVDFCSRRFGAEPVYSVPDLESLSFPGTFDLIWCGSLAPHLDAERILALLRVLGGHLSRGGVLVVTTHGDRAAERMREPGLVYIPAADRIAHILAGYEQQGFGYADYPWERSYGVSLSSPGWVRAQAARVSRLREASFHASGWDDHQDVFGFVRS